MTNTIQISPLRYHLPYPPSGWELYNGWGKTRHLSSTYKKWRTDAGYFIKPPAAPISVPFSLHIALKRQNVRQDIDNRSKAILDCLQHYGVIKNDNLCERLTMIWSQEIPADCVVLLQIAEEGLAA
ncbi:RusA family crossover junction endodeoxyribonuclease [Rhizobium sp. NZLR11]|uniref:RusA family crossover junction endodeoxyribonuclease n=1 Tax=Rhizobium sp. NZLR11 TaxID=2731098 RepID=UPI001C834FFC|nr:RusA family crossover junction endodeoxyribonuclease [Rhizobium sp. NZLR11]MBX5206711.1 RusA family crossover junction endodeoxyribonuclease [Rhizobium sp. NZLR11]